MRAKLPAILLVCGVALISQREDRRVLYDGRIGGGGQGRVQLGSKLSTESRQQLLSAVFPKRLTSAAGCDSERSRAGDRAEQIDPEVIEFAQGSFTAPGARQAVYLIQVNECLPPSRNYFGTYRLAVFEGARLIANPNVAANGIASIADVDGDGIEELLLIGTGFGQGDLEVHAKLVSLKSKRFQVFKDFDLVYENPCGLDERLPVTASAITYGPAGLAVQHYTAPCSSSHNGDVPALKDFTPSK
jgi:hypothetical protein